MKGKAVTEEYELQDLPSASAAKRISGPPPIAPKKKGAALFGAATEDYEQITSPPGSPAPPVKGKKTPLPPVPTSTSIPESTVSGEEPSDVVASTSSSWYNAGAVAAAMGERLSHHVRKVSNSEKGFDEMDDPADDDDVDMDDAPPPTMAEVKVSNPLRGKGLSQDFGQSKILEEFNKVIYNRDHAEITSSQLFTLFCLRNAEETMHETELPLLHVCRMSLPMDKVEEQIIPSDLYMYLDVCSYLLLCILDLPWDCSGLLQSPCVPGR
jgi:hypothetical protein